MENETLAKAFNLSIRYLSYRARSKKQIIKYLQGKDYNDDIILKVINRLEQIDYIDDNKFALNYINTVMAKQNKGISLVKKELMDRGINEDIISNSISAYSIEDEGNFAINISKKYFATKTNSPIKQIKTNLYNKLIRQGFSNESIYKAINYLDNSDEINKIIETKQETYKKQAYEFIRKYYPRYCNKGNDKFIAERKIFAKLLSKGYDYYLVEEVLNNYKIENDYHL